MRFRFFLVMLGFCGPVCAQDAPEDLAAWWSFEPLSERFVVEHASGAITAVASPFHAPEWIDGPVGKALRLDGYSTSVTLGRTLPDERQPREALTAEAWVALYSWPVSNAPFVNQYTFPGAGWFFGMDKWGRWYLAVSVNGQWRTCWASEPFPRGKWVHVAGTFDSATGRMQVYLDGNPAGSYRFAVPGSPLTVDATTKITVGKDVHTPMIGPFQTGLLNGAIDEVKVYRRALHSSEIVQSYLLGRPPPIDFSIPESRFAGDRLHRPRYHPLPPANWTNEPHGLARHRGGWHLFYQHNPNGPYWEQIHWGHMASKDLVRWEHLPIALAPQPGWDQRGIWSGDAVVHEDALTLVYTGVDGRKAGIGLATQADPDAHVFTPYAGNPVIASAPSGGMDFRDPWLWEEGGVWNMIIGSGMPGVGGTVFRYASSDLRSWSFEGAFYTGSRNTSGVFWEMPVFASLGEGKHLLAVTTVEERAPARALYWIGELDGGRFAPDDPMPRQLDLINHMLSPALEADDTGQLVAIGIVSERRSSEQQLQAGWAHAFSLPRVWRLCGDALCQAPLPALQALRRPETRRRYERVPVSGAGANLLPDASGRQKEIVAVLEPGSAARFGLDVGRSPDGREFTRIAYDTVAQTLQLDLRQSTLNASVSGKELYSAPFPVAADTPLKLHVFVDHSVLEVFVNDRAAFSTRMYPTLEASHGVDLFAEGGVAVAESVETWTLQDAFSAKPLSGERPLELPAPVQLDQNYPNPFSSRTAISFATNAPRHVHLAVYDLLGRELDVLMDAHIPPGSHVAVWDGVDSAGREVGSGVYFYQLHLGESMAARQMVLVR